MEERKNSLKEGGNKKLFMFLLYALNILNYHLQLFVVVSPLFLKKQNGLENSELNALKQCSLE